MDFEEFLRSKSVKYVAESLLYLPSYKVEPYRDQFYSSMRAVSSYHRDSNKFSSFVQNIIKTSSDYVSTNGCESG